MAVNVLPRAYMLMLYSQQRRMHQRLQASCLDIRTSQYYRPLQDLESKQLVYELLHSDDFAKVVEPEWG